MATDASPWSAPRYGDVACGVLATLLVHGVAALLFALAWAGAEVHPGSHGPLGAAVAVLLGLGGVAVAAWAWRAGRRAGRREVLPSPASRLAATLATALRWAMALVLIALAASGLLFADPTWGARVVVSDAHEALAAGFAGLLAAHGACAIAARIIGQPAASTSA